MSDNCFSEKVVYEAISDSLMSLRFLARKLLKQRWAKMTNQEKYKSGRALAALNIVSANPKQYFSSHRDDIAVRESVKRDVENNVIKSDFLAHFAEEHSAMTLFGQIAPLYFFNRNFTDTCRIVCLRIYMWERNRVSAEPKDREDAELYARNIVKFSHALKQAVVNHTSHPFMDKLRKFVYNTFQK